MNKKLWSLGLAAMMAVSGMALMISACAPDEGGPNTPDGPNTPVEHTHTYATAWSSDADQHWHAATCEHTTEKSDVAVHTFVGNVCSVCNYEKSVTVTAKCDIYCEICGMCMDVNCTEDKEKCGNGLKYYNLEAEEALCTNPINEEYVPSFANNWEDMDKDGYNGFCEFLQGIQGNAGVTATFTFTASKAMTATLRVRCGSPTARGYFTDGMLTMINGEIFENNKSYLSPATGKIPGKRCFEWINLGCITLQEGLNTIVVSVSVSDPSKGINLDKLQLLCDGEITVQKTDNLAFRVQAPWDATSLLTTGDELIALDDWWMVGDAKTKKLSEVGDAYNYLFY